MQLILIHGLGQTGTSWDKVISYLPKKIHTCVPELAALCGTNELTYSNLYTSFADYCNSISEPLNLCGISLGAILALNYTIEHPEKVNSLALIASQYKMPRRLLQVQNFVFSLMPNTVFRKMGYGKKDFILLTNSMSYLDFSDKVEEISCSTFIICGKKDKANRKASEELALKIQRSKLYIMENAGHEVNVDVPKDLASVLKHFLDFNKESR